MKQIILLFGLAALAGCSTLDRPFYYEVEKDGRTARVLGTGHYGWDMDRLPKRVLGDFDTSTIFVMETADWFTPEEEKQDKKERGDWSVAQTKRNGKAGSKTSSRLTPEAWKYVMRVLKNERESVLELLPPLVLIDMLAAAEPARVRFTDSKMWYRYSFERMDQQLRKRSVKLGKPRVSLDDKRTVPWECEDELALVSIEFRAANIDRARDFEEFYEAYQSGDEKHLDDYIKGWNNPRVDQCLIYDRNKKWVPRFIDYFNNNSSVFVAVGAAHLVGADNFLQDLRNRGFTVKRLEQ